MNDVHRSFAKIGLIRPQEGRFLGGVLAGLGARVGLDPWPTRILFLIALALIPGTQIFWLYPIMWVLMPSQEKARKYSAPYLPTAA
ncbi:PspC domain-containing protein [Cryptosporangium sp. NPDC048952]|uniref:PspC domain-containing protein n=1 Tax=Cryptosporangium sp. NPDC048952 TaxID=3363961 RepID=UPI003717CDD3